VKSARASRHLQPRLAGAAGLLLPLQLRKQSRNQPLHRKVLLVAAVVLPAKRLLKSS
jgi:hypothetical protein